MFFSADPVLPVGATARQRDRFRGLQPGSLLQGRGADQPDSRLSVQAAAFIHLYYLTHAVTCSLGCLYYCRSRSSSTSPTPLVKAVWVWLLLEQILLRIGGRPMLWNCWHVPVSWEEFPQFLFVFGYDPSLRAPLCEIASLWQRFREGLPSLGEAFTWSSFLLSLEGGC